MDAETLAFWEEKVRQKALLKPLHSDHLTDCQIEAVKTELQDLREAGFRRLDLLNRLHQRCCQLGIETNLVMLYDLVAGREALLRVIQEGNEKQARTMRENAAKNGSRGEEIPH